MSRRIALRARKSRYLARSRSMFRKIKDIERYNVKSMEFEMMGRIERCHFISSPIL